MNTARLTLGLWTNWDRKCYRTHHIVQTWPQVTGRITDCGWSVTAANWRRDRDQAWTPNIPEYVIQLHACRVVHTGQLTVEMWMTSEAVTSLLMHSWLYDYYQNFTNSSSFCYISHLSILNQTLIQLI